MNDGKRQVMGESKPDENPIATIYYENGTDLTAADLVDWLQKNQD